MERNETLAHASRVAARAQLIKDERGLEDNAAYELAERELAAEAVPAQPGPFRLEQTVSGVVARKGAYWLHFDAHQLEQVIEVGRRYLASRRKHARVRRAKMITRHFG